MACTAPWRGGGRHPRGPGARVLARQPPIASDGSVGSGVGSIGLLSGAGLRCQAIRHRLAQETSQPNHTIILITATLKMIRVDRACKRLVRATDVCHAVAPRHAPVASRRRAAAAAQPARAISIVLTLIPIYHARQDCQPMSNEPLRPALRSGAASIR
jgi:hypothetical protein